MIHFKQIVKSFGKQQVLHGFDILINEPGIYAILGPNGSGKTTLIKTLMGMVHPDAGEIWFMNQRVVGNNYRRHLAYLPQIARFPENLTPIEYLDLIENIRGPASRRNTLTNHFGLELFLNKTLRNLSGGTRQKINLVSALMYDTQVLVLDEPTIGLDPVALLKLKDWIKQERSAEK
ncbi:MAG: ABC transporter ATP-binding protein [Owenweeksia sp.]|nr:ABC transporter ATP-binding protein [Owenweeksia sp.]